MSSPLAPRPAQLAELATITPAVEAAVQAWQLARGAREDAWADYQRLADAHERKVRLTTLPSGRKPRRSREYIQAEQRFDHFEHKASYAEGDIERALRAANPGADNRTIMATKRELTRAAR